MRQIILPTKTIIREPNNKRFAHISESPFTVAKRLGRNLYNGSLKEFYNREFFVDLLERNLIDPSEQTRKMNINFQILAGFIFEAFVVRRINSNPTVKEKVLKWILGDNVLENNHYSNLDDILAIAIGGGGTKRNFPDLYFPGHPNIDILFIDQDKKWYPPLIDKYNRMVGVQLKAIKGDYFRSIIKKVIGISYFGKPPIYKNVLTLLRHDSVKHSYDECIDILYKNFREKLSFTELEEISERIIQPKDIGLDQDEIDFYYELIKDWFYNPQNYKFSKMDNHLIDSLHILNLNFEQMHSNSNLKNHILL